jgi:hypothetical protein
LASPSAKSTRDWLLEIGDAEQLERLLTEMCTGTEQPGGALLQAVCSADTPVEDLIAIKRIAKRLAVFGRSPRPKRGCYPALPPVAGIRAGAPLARHLVEEPVGATTAI